ncbi:DUF4352 domain-containing protein [Sphingobium sp. TKS]|uniref:DUF4352 domain-containing protein n=1 Tax=Sphingobium sp. TKS TaxID=1315974 RepID=UPI0007703D31|nr:DUF4352 domain-containing protein [Sphingobium sp. TKS]AMK24410.1 YxkC [Sphingobium sp. TKS]
MKKIVPLLCLAVLSACDQAPTQQLDNPGTVISDVPPAKPLAIGQTGQAEGVDLTLNSVKVTNQIGMAGVGPKLGEGETYVVANYHLKNTSKEPLSIFEWPKLNLVDAGGASYVADDTATAMAAAMATAESSISTDLNPGVGTKWVMVWKIAKNGFDKATWKIVADTSPQHIFALK